MNGIDIVVKVVCKRGKQKRWKHSKTAKKTKTSPKVNRNKTILLQEQNETINLKKDKTKKVISCTILKNESKLLVEHRRHGQN